MTNKISIGTPTSNLLPILKVLHFAIALSAVTDQQVRLYFGWGAMLHSQCEHAKIAGFA
jgi:hypothetical protein